MYYQEKMVQGIICYKTSPNGAWKPITVDKLGSMDTEHYKRLCLDYYSSKAVSGIINITVKVDKGEIR